MAGLFQRLDTHMVDSHLMLSAMKPTSKIRRNYPAKWARDAANDPEYLGTLWRWFPKGEPGPRGTNKRKSHAHPTNPPTPPSPPQPPPHHAPPPPHPHTPPHLPAP